jgi:hypothetical protein
MARTNKAINAVSLETRIGTVIDTEFAVMASTGEAKDAAYALLNGIASKAALDPVRDAVKAAYITRYLADGISADKEKAKNAANMFWSRTVARATERGYVKPLDMSPEAVKARDKRAAALAKSGKVDGRTTKTGSNASNKKASAVTVIVPESDDDDLQDALDYVMESPEHQVAFKLWYAKQISTTRTIHRVA